METLFVGGACMKRFLAAALALLMVVTLGISAFAEESVEEAEVGFPKNAEAAMEMSLRAYEENDADTKDFSSPFLRNLAVFGSNDLEIVSDREEYPYCAIARMVSHFRCGCNVCGTGFMVSQKGLMTAAHYLVCTKHSKTVDGITLYFGYNNDRNYYYKYDGGASYWYGTDFSNGYEPEDDYGYVKFKDPVGDYTGWFGLRVISDSDFNEDGIWSISGYFGNDLFYDIDHASVRSEKTIKHEIDTMAGMGGSPIYTFDCAAVAINVGENSSSNVARRITSSLIKQMWDNGVL